MLKRFLVIVPMAIIFIVFSASAWFVICASGRNGYFQNKIDRIFGFQLTGKPTLSQVGKSSIDTSSWKVYKNDQYGLEFRYPSDESWLIETFNLTISEQPSSQGEGVSIRKKSNGVSGGKSESITFFVHDTVWGSENLYLRNVNHSKVQVFDFAGETATIDQSAQGYFSALFKKHRCIKDFVFSLPHLPLPWDSNETVSVSCGDVTLSKKDTLVLVGILESIRFSNSKTKN